MNKSVLIIALAFAIVSCDKKQTAPKEFKTAFVDTQVLMDECAEAKDIQAKFKALADEKGKQLEGEVNRFKAEAANFQKDAQAKGQAWAQQKGAELQKKQQQLEYAQQSIGQELQGKMEVEKDSVKVKMQKDIKSFGKEKGYTYIYGSNATLPSVLYSDEKLDITKEIVTLINKNYKPASKK
jgi:outer membrane protein